VAFWDLDIWDLDIWENQMSLHYKNSDFSIGFAFFFHLHKEKKTMGKAKKTRKFAVAKKVISAKDSRM
jgi:hypothetical protein